MAQPRLSKRAAQSAFAARFASALFGVYIRLVDMTTRWRYLGRELADPVLNSPEGVILAFWHQRLMMTPHLRRESKKRAYMLISQHRDGEIIADAVKGYGIEFIRGSAADPRKRFKEKGGAPALVQMIAALKDGAFVGVTPDGPRGPACKAQSGIVKLAQLSGAPILPVAYSVSGGRFLDTWDKFLLAYPFSRGVFAAAPPIRVPADADAATLENARRGLERALNDAASRADKAVGRSPEHVPLG